MKYFPFAALLIFILVSKFLISCSTEKKEESGELLSESWMHVPNGFVIERVAGPDMVTYPVFATFDSLGRLFVIESSGKTTSTEDVLKNPSFKIRLLQDLDGDGIFDKSQVFADKIPYPMGGTFYRGSFYATAPPDLLRFTDTDGDGSADKREVILTGWVLNHNAATLSGPFFGPDGWMYMCDARRGFDIRTKEGTELKGKGARIWRCRPDGSGLESYAGGGFDNTIEMIFMPSGETIGTMTYFTDPRDGERDALMHWVEGGVYPKPYTVIEEDKLKLTGDLMPVMTRLPRVSPAGLMRYRGSVFGNGYDGNLFSAQFNTGRIMRHVITPSGATFTTADEPFMVSDSLDGHPTDVLEDADGSLLVVNTGGWFIAGCPLSVVAKTDIHGGIFRIRKTGAPLVKDPWGNTVDYKNMPVDQLIDLMQDSRTAVADKAIEQIILRGDPAVSALKEFYNSAEAETLRTAVVFALYRIGSRVAMDVVVAALADKSAVVRTAAARVCGLAKEAKAVDLLIKMVQDDLASVRRQAATALGQIGDARAVSALLSAAENPEDRYVEHAIIYALITLGKEDVLAQGLKSPSVRARKAALIALDQMDGEGLTKNDVAPFLQSSDAELRSTGIWVAARHPGWSDIVVAFVAAQRNRPVLSENEKISLRDLMVGFSQDKRMQDFVASQLVRDTLRIGDRLMMLDVVGRCPLKALPEKWVGQLGKLLADKNFAIRSEVLDLIQARSTPQLNGKLQQIIDNGKMSTAFRLKALSARVMSDPKLSNHEFKMLVALLRPGTEAPVRQFAARLLAQAEPTDAQLLTLAGDVRDADAFMLPALVNCFGRSESGAVGTALIAALAGSTDRLDNLPVDDMRKLFTAYPASVRESGEPLLIRMQEKQATRLSELQTFQASLHGGDVGQGRKLFFGKALCSTCHAVAGNGGDFGPDLTNIGEIRSGHDILEAIMFPGASYAREYETSKVVTKANTYTGIIKEQLPETIVVKTGPGAAVRIARNEITAIEPQNISLMLPGLHKQLTTGEMADLMAYLTTLPDGLGKVRRGEL